MTSDDAYKNVLAAGLRVAKWMAWIGLGCGVVYSVGGLISDLLTTGLNRGTALAFGALLGMPLALAALGFLAGTAWGAIRHARRADIE